MIVILLCMEQDQVYDLAVVGAGVAGYTASIYASRYQINNVVIGELPGGMISEAYRVCNFPTEIDISGAELTQKMQSHAKQLGANEISDLVKSVTKNLDRTFTLELSSQGPIKARVVLLATGTKRRRLGVPGEKEFSGKGVAYCATCDGFFYKGKVVAVIGGSDTANTAALYLATLAEKVYQIYRGPTLRGVPVWVDQIAKNPKIELVLNTNVVAMKGDQKLAQLELDTPYNGSATVSVDGVFIEIGADPDNILAQGLGVELSEYGYIEVKENQSTNIAGIYAAGDNTTASNKFQQVVTACSEGAIAAASIREFLQTQ